MWNLQLLTRKVLQIRGVLPEGTSGCTPCATPVHRRRSLCIAAVAPASVLPPPHIV
jgi:hypothetical protein